MVTRKRKVHRAAVDRMVEALATGPEHAALVESCRALADELDGCPGFDDRRWREYRLNLATLLECASGGPRNDDFDKELEQMRAEVGNASNARKAQSRRPV